MGQGFIYHSFSIIEYIIMLDFPTDNPPTHTHSDTMVVANATAPGTLFLTSLTPYTLYIVQVEACTQFGCTASDLVAMRTLEGGE